MINARALLITFSLLGFFIVLTLVLFKIQVADHERYELLASRQQNKLETVKAERGTIKDRNNDMLAFTKDDVSFFVDTRMELYPIDLWWDYVSISNALPGWEALLDKYEIRNLMLDLNNQAELMGSLETSSNWALVYKDSVAAIFHRSGNYKNSPRINQ